MSHPLVWLLWCDTRRAAGALGARLRRPRGALTAVGLIFFVVLLMFSGRGPSAGANLPVYGPPALMLLVMLGMFSPLGLYFRPSDVHWLLPAPLSRRELVLYNVAVRARPALFSGLLLALLPAWRGGSVWGAFTGYTLVFLLLQTSSQWIAVVRAWAALRWPLALRRIVAVAVWALPALAVVVEMRLRPEQGMREFMESSTTVAVFSAPARPFLEMVSAAGATSWLVAAALSVAILAALVTHICVLPVPYLETAVGQSERRSRRFARMRGGGGAFAATRARSVRRLPVFPRLGGAGPVAWRQLQELVRNPHGIGLVLAIVACVLGACLAIPWLRDGDAALAQRTARTGMFLVAILPLLMGDNLACDFRRDLDRMGVLKGWPISAGALAAGQIAPAAIFVTCVQWLGFGALLLLTRAVPLDFALLVMGLLPVISWVALCVDNLLFLWAPYRTTPEDPGDVGFVGRTFATAMFKFISLVVILGTTLVLGYGTLQTTGSRMATVLVPLSTLLGACVLGTYGVARAFRRFDIASDVPA